MSRLNDGAIVKGGVDGDRNERIAESTARDYDSYRDEEAIPFAAATSEGDDDGGGGGGVGRDKDAEAEWSDKDEKVVKSSDRRGPYDFPKLDESYIDDGQYAAPFRRITDWFLTKRDNFNVRLPLPNRCDSFRNIVVCGTLLPDPAFMSTTTKKKKRKKEKEAVTGSGGNTDDDDDDVAPTREYPPIKARFERTIHWSIDRSHTERGIWIVTPIAWYHLIKPCSIPTLQPNGALLSQEDVHLPMRAKFGLVSNLSDMLGELSVGRCEPGNGDAGTTTALRDSILSVHIARTPRQSYDLLCPSEELLRVRPDLNRDPFDYQLLQREAHFVYAHLKAFDAKLTSKCAFMKGLMQMKKELVDAKKAGEEWATVEMTPEQYRKSAMLAEQRSQRMPWGDMRPGVSHPSINEVLLIRVAKASKKLATEKDSETTKKEGSTTEMEGETTREKSSSNKKKKKTTTTTTTTTAATATTTRTVEGKRTKLKNSNKNDSSCDPTVSIVSSNSTNGDDADASKSDYTPRIDAAQARNEQPEVIVLDDSSSDEGKGPGDGAGTFDNDDNSDDENDKENDTGDKGRLLSNHDESAAKMNLSTKKTKSASAKGKKKTKTTSRRRSSSSPSSLLSSSSPVDRECSAADGTNNNGGMDTRPSPVLEGHGNNGDGDGTRNGTLADCSDHVDGGNVNGGSGGNVNDRRQCLSRPKKLRSKRSRSGCVEGGEGNENESERGGTGVTRDSSALVDEKKQRDERLAPGSAICESSDDHDHDNKDESKCSAEEEKLFSTDSEEEEDADDNADDDWREDDDDDDDNDEEYEGNDDNDEDNDDDKNDGGEDGKRLRRSMNGGTKRSMSFSRRSARETRTAKGKGGPGRRRPRPRASALSDCDADQGKKEKGDKGSGIDGAARVVPTEERFRWRQLEVLETPTDYHFLADFNVRRAKQSLKRYLCPSFGAKKKPVMAVKEDAVDDFLRDVVCAETVDSYETMLVALEALRYSTSTVVRSLFREIPSPSTAEETWMESGCRSIFVTWRNRVLERMVERREKPLPRALIKEMTNQFRNMRRTEEVIAVTIIQLIKVCCGPMSCGRQCPQRVYSEFGVDFDFILNEMIEFAHANEVAALSEACEPVRIHLLQIRRISNPRESKSKSGSAGSSSRVIPGDPSLIANMPPLPGHILPLSGRLFPRTNDVLGNVSGTERSYSTNRLIPDYDQKKLRRQQIRAEVTKQLDIEEELAELRAENAKLRGSLEHRRRRSECSEDLPVPKRKRFGKSAAILGSEQSNTRNFSLKDTLVKISMRHQDDDNSLSSSMAPSMHSPSPPPMDPNVLSDDELAAVADVSAASWPGRSSFKSPGGHSTPHSRSAWSGSLKKPTETGEQGRGWCSSGPAAASMLPTPATAQNVPAWNGNGNRSSGKRWEDGVTPACSAGSTYSAPFQGDTANGDGYGGVSAQTAGIGTAPERSGVDSSASGWNRHGDGSMQNVPKNNKGWGSASETNSDRDKGAPNSQWSHKRGNQGSGSVWESVGVSSGSVWESVGASSRSEATTQARGSSNNAPAAGWGDQTQKESSCTTDQGGGKSSGGWSHVVSGKGSGNAWESVGMSSEGAPNSQWSHKRDNQGSGNAWESVGTSSGLEATTQARGSSNNAPAAGWGNQMQKERSCTTDQGSSKSSGGWSHKVSGNASGNAWESVSTSSEGAPNSQWSHKRGNQGSGNARESVGVSSGLEATTRARGSSDKAPAAGWGDQMQKERSCTTDQESDKSSVGWSHKVSEKGSGNAWETVGASSKGVPNSQWSHKRGNQGSGGAWESVGASFGGV